MQPTITIKSDIEGVKDMMTERMSESEILFVCCM